MATAEADSISAANLEAAGLGSIRVRRHLRFDPERAA
jgi:hypothetical protein